MVNWFELKAQYIATWTPRPALQGVADGARAYGLVIDEALYRRALEIHEGWRSDLARREANLEARGGEDA